MVLGEHLALRFRRFLHREYQTKHRFDCRRLSGSVRAKYSDDGTALDFERNIIDGSYGGFTLPERLLQPFNPYSWLLDGVHSISIERLYPTNSLIVPIAIFFIILLKDIMIFRLR